MLPWPATAAPARRLGNSSRHRPISAGTPPVVASGLTNPRGFTWGADGTLYVALAGNGGTSPAVGELLPPPADLGRHAPRRRQRPDQPPWVHLGCGRYALCCPGRQRRHQPGGWGTPPATGRSRPARPPSSPAA